MTTEEELRESNKHLFNGFIEVLKAHMEGKTIQHLPKFESYKDEWKDINNNYFNDFDLGEYFYRVKPNISEVTTTKFSLLYYPIPSEYKSITFAYDEVLMPQEDKVYEKLVRDSISDILANRIPDHISVLDFIHFIQGSYNAIHFTDISIQSNKETYSLGFFDDKTNITMDIYFDLHSEYNLVFECEGD